MLSSWWRKFFNFSYVLPTVITFMQCWGYSFTLLTGAPSYTGLLFHSCTHATYFASFSPKGGYGSFIPLLTDPWVRAKAERCSLVHSSARCGGSSFLMDRFLLFFSLSKKRAWEPARQWAYNIPTVLFYTIFLLQVKQEHDSQSEWSMKYRKEPVKHPL